MIRLAVVVQKYGGSSVADSVKIKNVARRIARKVREGFKVVSVVSAMGKTTDQLISLAKSVSENPNERELDMVLVTGEQVSCALVAMALRDLGINAISLNAFQACSSWYFSTCCKITIEFPIVISIHLIHLLFLFIFLFYLPMEIHIL